MAILDSVNELAKRFGVETEEQTISEQIDAINQKLDDTYPGSRDIEEAVSQFAKNDGPDARLGTKTITQNDTYIALDDELDGYSSVTVNVAAPTPETFEVEMVLTTADRSVSIVTSKTLQETLDAIEAGKQISFSATYDGRRAEVICYGVWDLQLGTGDSITMLLYDGVGEIITVYWTGDGNLVSISQGTVYMAGVSS